MFSKFGQLTQIAADDLEAGSVVAVSDQLEEEVRETRKGKRFMVSSLPRK